MKSSAASTKPMSPVWSRSTEKFMPGRCPTSGSTYRSSSWSSAAAMGKSETDEGHRHQLLVAAEAAKNARKKHRHQLLEVAACERICLSCWMPCSPWIADDRKLDVYWSDDYLMIHGSRFPSNKRQNLKIHYYCAVFGWGSQWQWWLVSAATVSATLRA